MNRARQYLRLFLVMVVAGLGLFAAGTDDVLAVQKNIQLSSGDGYIVMADGRPMYIFGFSDISGIVDPQDALAAGQLAANFPAPTIVVDEGDEFYLTLYNVGMLMRPDLFDPHTVHWHGFPQAAPIFDGLPESSISIGMGPQPLTYYYNVIEPGTYMYHCHVEATEHMQMGMLGNLYVRPAQNRLADGTMLGSHEHDNPDWNADPALDDPTVGDKYAYNDGDGSTLYHVEYALQMTAFDDEFHDASESAQPLPFYQMRDTYPMLNGRGYPDTANPAPLAAPEENGYQVSQPVSSLVTAEQGQKVLLRISNLGVVHQYTLTTNMGVPMKVVGFCARLYRGPTGTDLYYDTNSVTLSGGESIDVIIDTTGVAPGTYFLYTTNLNFLSNGQEDFGGMMTEIVITTP